MQAKTPFHNMTCLLIVKLELSCRREHHTYIMFIEKGVIACTRVHVLNYMCSHAGEDTISKHDLTADCQTRALMQARAPNTYYAQNKNKYIETRGGQRGDTFTGRNNSLLRGDVRRNSLLRAAIRMKTPY